jgi:uncharacterized spore protein YtfJ
MVSTVRERGINGLAVEQTTTQADETAEQPDAAGLLERMARRIGMQARATTIYGEPIDRDGVTVIPIARARWMFGGGAGHDNEQQAGSGGGGGASVSPVGYIEIKDGASRFYPIITPPVGIIAAVAGLVLGVVLGRMLARQATSRTAEPRWMPGQASGWPLNRLAAGHAPAWAAGPSTHWHLPWPHAAPWSGPAAWGARLGRQPSMPPLARLWRARS